MNTTTVQSPVHTAETSHPPRLRPPTESEPPRRVRRQRRTSWVARLVARLRRPRSETDPYTAHQNELERVEREAKHARALVYFGGFR
ncbi:hypothetical protein [Paramicrobacterium agarici]|uniref:Uncharacterized protein n=1 Tax=Paramicrobacterium agarici TaxID=630514 RepID=A0A2A9DRD3_9MICO|nr:hypothetical protein [Microbacterium agarici]PFG29337.1 hypothetical protein ATJ78_0242 [Microbacterium agarici]